MVSKDGYGYHRIITLFDIWRQLFQKYVGTEESMKFQEILILKMWKSVEKNFSNI